MAPYVSSLLIPWFMGTAKTLLLTDQGLQDFFSSTLLVRRPNPWEFGLTFNIFLDRDTMLFSPMLFDSSLKLGFLSPLFSRPA